MVGEEVNTSVYTVIVTNWLYTVIMLLRFTMQKRSGDTNRVKETILVTKRSERFTTMDMMMITMTTL